MTVGFIGVVLAVLLFRNGFTTVQIGFVIAGGVTGAAVATSLSAAYVDRIGRRGSLALLSMLATVPIFGLAWRSSFIRRSCHECRTQPRVGSFVIVLRNFHACGITCSTDLHWQFAQN